MFYNAYTNIINMHLILIIKLILHNLIIYPLDQVENISKPSTTKVYVCVCVCVCHSITCIQLFGTLWPATPRLLAATAKSLQLCPTLCDPIDGSPPGSPIPGILQARTLEWVAISFSRRCS